LRRWSNYLTKQRESKWDYKRMLRIGWVRVSQQ
jgi:hypothetical protein